MRTQRAWIPPVLTLLAVVGATANVQAQSYPYPPVYQNTGAPAQLPPQGLAYDQSVQAAPSPWNGGYDPAAYAPNMYGGVYPATAYPATSQPGGYAPAAYYPGAAQQAAPAVYQPGMAMAPPAGPQGASFAGYYETMDGGQYCPSCGGQGCGQCGGTDFDFRLLKFLLPYSDGGCCAPRWYDFHAEFVSLKREDSGAFIPFTSDGPAGGGPPLIVLSTDDLDFHHEAGVRFSAALQVLAAGNLEFSYLGTFNWHSHAAVTSDLDELYSVLSDFGTNPPPQAGPPILRGGYTDTDSAELHSIDYSTAFDSFEFFYRKRWTGPNCRLQGSWLAGARYFLLDESFLHSTRVDYQDPNDPGNPNARITGAMDYTVNTYNSLTGFQLGGDLWACIIPGLKIGGELKAGIYGNRADQGTVIYADSLANPVVERARHSDVAFLGEFNAMALYRINYHWTFRAGYQVLFIDGVALAPENFNVDPPFSAPRTAVIHDNGNVFYHGLTAGLEWMW